MNLHFAEPLAACNNNYRKAFLLLSVSSSIARSSLDNYRISLGFWAFKYAIS